MRATFDKLISFTGLALAAVLIAAGGLLTWANTFIDDQVHDQLTMQGITMPEGEALSPCPRPTQDALQQYAGSPLDTGPEAKAFADHYILVHMNASPRSWRERSCPTPRSAARCIELSADEANRRPQADGEAAEWGAPAAVALRWATPCAACCSTATRSPRSAPSPVSPPSSRSGAAGLLLVLVLLGLLARSPGGAHCRAHRPGASASARLSRNKRPPGCLWAPGRFARQFSGVDSRVVQQGRSWYDGTSRAPAYSAGSSKPHHSCVTTVVSWSTESTACGRVMSQWSPGPSNPFVAEATTRAWSVRCSATSRSPVPPSDRLRVLGVRAEQRTVPQRGDPAGLHPVRADEALACADPPLGVVEDRRVLHVDLDLSRATPVGRAEGELAEGVAARVPVLLRTLAGEVGALPGHELGDRGVQGRGRGAPGRPSGAGGGRSRRRSLVGRGRLLVLGLRVRQQTGPRDARRGGHRHDGDGRADDRQAAPAAQRRALLAGP